MLIVTKILHKNNFQTTFSEFIKFENIKGKRISAYRFIHFRINDFNLTAQTDFFFLEPSHDDLINSEVFFFYSLFPLKQHTVSVCLRKK